MTQLASTEAQISPDVAVQKVFGRTKARISPNRWFVVPTIES